MKIFKCKMEVKSIMKKSKILFGIFPLIMGVSLSSCEHYVYTHSGANRQHSRTRSRKTTRHTTKHTTRSTRSSGNSYVGLRTLKVAPVDHYVITSKYGYRYHPIKHKRILHTGVDYATKHNTPIHATAPGVVTFRGTKRGYGYTVIIKHNHTYSTLYAHMDHFARGVRKGSHVRSHQVIGYVGKTGAATGYHVHYEIQKNGKPINPR